jgi:hypothetical protein
MESVVAKFIAKFRKDRDYQDDYLSKKKPTDKRTRHQTVELKRMRHNDYEELLEAYQNERSED